ncbi:MAG: hypothetical protein KC469_08440 [Flavobacteriaceae bacterium]|nr:hypothetical protein [Flavobacteriaceae bacterium]
MIKFFRHIRQRLLAEGKTGKYLKYAIGEIILVVIGILIALQINTWNEGRKNNAKEQQILIQLKDEYNANLLQLEQKITHRKRIIKAANKILEHIDSPSNVNSDSLNSQLSIMIGNPTFKPIQNNLINSGDILLIRNEKLNQLLTSWPSSVKELVLVEGIWNTNVWGSITDLYNEFGVMRDGYYKWWNDDQNLKWILEGTSENPFQKPMTNKALKPIEILNSKKLEGTISLAVSVNYAANLQSNVLRKRVLEILDLLNHEIAEK